MAYLDRLCYVVYSILVPTPPQKKKTGIKHLINAMYCIKGIINKCVVLKKIFEMSAEYILAS